MISTGIDAISGRTTPEWWDNSMSKNYKIAFPFGKWGMELGEVQGGWPLVCLIYSLPFLLLSLFHALSLPTAAPSPLSTPTFLPKHCPGPNTTICTLSPLTLLQHLHPYPHLLFPPKHHPHYLAFVNSMLPLPCPDPEDPEEKIYSQSCMGNPLGLSSWVVWCSR